MTELFTRPSYENAFMLFAIPVYKNTSNTIRYSVLLKIHFIYSLFRYKKAQLIFIRYSVI